MKDLFDDISIKIVTPALKKALNNKVVLITGAAGSIGSEIAQQLTEINCKKLILIDQAESDLYNLQQLLNGKEDIGVKIILADIRNKKRIDLIFKTFRPNIVFHAAAYKHVPLMEDYPYEAIHVNVLGTMIVSDISLKYKVEKFVFISTDKAVNPTSIMGVTKRIAEIYINELNKETSTSKFITTRFGNVMRSNGSVIPLFKKQIENDGPLTLTHKDMTRYFISIPEACHLILESCALGNEGGTFVFDMGAPIKIFDLAKKLIRLSHLNYPEDIAIKIIGLRSGEKLHEELIKENEKVLPTRHKKIKRIEAYQKGRRNIKPNILELCIEEDQSKLLARLKELVPEFETNNPIFRKPD